MKVFEIGSPPQDAFFEDFKVGHTMVTEGRTVTEADVINFAGLSGDFHPLHTSEAYAAKHLYGRRIAHGVLGVAIATGLAMSLGIINKSIIAFRGLTAKFSKPVFIGDTIYARFVITQLKPMPRMGGGLVEMESKVFNQCDEVVQTGTWSIISRLREDQDG
ncbi:MAG: MaoC family dehydratase N-terminal domain-containing protein [Anaerolineae bacterium]|nr:MaoC family dehydratase N-terminal domain-containing protein [Anaerolineae bacterium]